MPGVDAKGAAPLDAVGAAEKGFHAAISRVLFVYAKLNPGIRYVQGMNELVAPIYYVFAQELEAAKARRATTRTAAGVAAAAPAGPSASAASGGVSLSVLDGGSRSYSISTSMKPIGAEGMPNQL